MDVNRNRLKSDLNANNLQSVESPEREAVMDGQSDGDDESQALLHSQEGRSPKESENPRRKVQWSDKNGDNLAEILEFQPSDVSDSDEDDSDSCFCRIM